MQTGKSMANHQLQQQQQLNVPVQYNNQLYDRIRCLGRGSFGTAVVYRRRIDCSLVVLKEIELLNFRSEREKCSVINEARIMSKLSHNNIVKYLNAYTTETKLIIEMEYASLGTLAGYLSLQMQPLGEQEVIIIFRQIACGLSYLHSKKIIHLDLKMANIFVTAEGLIKIGDFGIAQYIRDSPIKVSSASYNRKKPIKRDSSHLGTLAYSSPERCLGEPTSFKSDIWSLGCILYELITSKPLFSSNNLSDLLISITQISFEPITDNISPTLKYIFELTIARDPQQRPNASDLLDMIDRLLSQNEIVKNELQVKRPSHRFDLSSVAFFAAQNQNNLDQISYLHSLVYQVRLDTQHIRVERVNLPQSKRIKEISKGKSHFLVLTYDNIVYGWGSRAHGELGSCGLNAGGISSRERSTRSSIDSRFANQMNHALSVQHSASQTISAASSLASSTHTIIPNQKRHSVSTPCQQVTKDFIMNELSISKPVTRPIVINELNNRRIIQVAAGKGFSVFLSKTGIVMTCGDGSSGCLGRGDFRSNYTPKMVESLLNKDVVFIASGPEHVVAVCGNGQAFSWGKNRNGRLGIGRGSGSGSESFERNNGRILCHAPLTIDRYDKTVPSYVLCPRPVILNNQVHIKSVFCGDKCTVFIDSDNQCWACGENRSNRLGLDRKRKWKTKTIIVDRNSIPQQIKSLKRYQIVSCSIGRNHSSFVTHDGKLIVFGRDIDYSNKFKTGNNNLHTSQELYRGRPFQSFSNNNNHSTNQLESHRSILSNHRLLSRTASNLSLPSTAKRRLSVFIKFSRKSRKQQESYLKKSRLMKKMPLESVVGVSCTSKSTLALTENNRIYFWGTRSYPHNDEDSTKNPLEPQLVQSSQEECFVKVGTTNSSLMKNIQSLGSDQPIIHAQDPKLMVKTLSDLWILDYKLDNVCSSVRSCECSVMSSLSSNSYCSLCSKCNSTPNNSCNSSQSSLDSHSFTTTSKAATRHDAILEPQPIISLYVPSMFNQSRCSLQIVDLFCHLEDRFYLVLDTTIMLQHCQSRPNSTPPHASTLYRMNSRKNHSFPASHVNYTQDNVSYDGGLVEVDIQVDGDLVNNIRVESPKFEVNDKKVLKENYDSQFHLDLETNEKDGVSFEEPRSLSTFVSSLDNHIVMGLSVCSSKGSPMMPLVFDDAEGSKIIYDDDDKTPQNSCSKSEMSNTNAETSSMPSWVKNEFIQCQLSNNNVHNIDYETQSIDSHKGSLFLERSSIFKHDALHKGDQLNDPIARRQRSLDAQDTISNTSEQTIEEGTFKRQIDQSFRKIKTTVSRSQPDICDNLTNHLLTSSAIDQRRASIMTNRSVRNSANLLQCEVYQNRTSARHLTPESNSTFHLRSNSESQLDWNQPPEHGLMLNQVHNLTDLRLKQLEINTACDVHETHMNNNRTNEQFIWSSWSSRLAVVSGKGLRKGGSYKMDGKSDKPHYSSSSYSLRRSLLKLFC